MVPFASPVVNSLINSCIRSSSDTKLFMESILPKPVGPDIEVDDVVGVPGLKGPLLFDICLIITRVAFFKDGLGLRTGDGISFGEIISIDNDDTSAVELKREGSDTVRAGAVSSSLSVKQWRDSFERSGVFLSFVESGVDAGKVGRFVTLFTSVTGAVNGMNPVEETEMVLYLKYGYATFCLTHT
jgi:hypothetical protein